MNQTDRLAELLHRLQIGCRLDYRGDIDCGGGRFMCHTDPAERLRAAGVTFADAESARHAALVAAAQAVVEHEIGEWPDGTIYYVYTGPSHKHWAALRAALEPQP